jgi:hypothetical protein
MMKNLGIGFLFGHYDSRGGATLIPTPNALTAIEHYAESFGFTNKDGEEWNQATRFAMNDFISIVEVHVIGPEFDVKTPQELLSEYGGEYASFQLFHGALEEPVLVLVHKSEFPTEDDWPESMAAPAELDGEKYHLEHWALGEDAYGLIWEV